MRAISDYLHDVRRVAIGGHVNPDGDCIGSCMALYLYLKDCFPEISADVYLQNLPGGFDYLKGLENIRFEVEENAEYDLLILLDIGSADRVGVIGGLPEKTEKVLVIDHHRTNPGGYTWFFNDPDISSASEFLWHFLDPDRISPDCAAALYTGIVHDTGVFQYSNTTPETMRIAAGLMEKGIPASRIIDESYYQKSYVQQMALGKVLCSSRIHLNGRCISGFLTMEDMQSMGLKSTDMDGIVSQLRNTEGTDVAIFLYPVRDGFYKVSLRSRQITDVSRIAVQFGGGGHIRAAGCSASGDPGKIIEDLVKLAGEQLQL